MKADSNILVTVAIRKEALPLSRSSITLKRQALELNLRAYQSRLTEFEERHRMTSDQFEAALNAGQPDDNAEWFEWKFVRDAYQEAKQQLDLLNSAAL